MDVVTKDGTKFHLAPELFRQSVFLRHLSEEASIPSEGVHLLVDSDVFRKILVFLENHSSDPEVSEDYDAFDVMLNDFDREFVEMDNVLLFRVTSAANYLHTPLLLEICCKVIADSLKEKTTDEIKKYLAIPNDIHPKEEETAIQKEYEWIS
ncbi:S-phase kinase-associated protein 1 [Nematocida displodere]|uniref:E3 ubiquitin ligase complex SCF subunit n=1 Tax=Nematocida displodere TaxID=1805483 RepID=A0A177EBP3_9MICR|nr:S-phase kinase-associated protein 1 [Nematocida displodere]